jgi:hypothetical protein
VVIVIFSKAYIIICEVGYVRQHNVPPFSFHKNPNNMVSEPKV